MPNYILLKIEVETIDGKVYLQPNCRIKTTPEGNVMCLVRENEEGRWKGVKGRVKINKFVLRKEYYMHKNKIRIPMWLIRLFGIPL